MPPPLLALLEDRISIRAHEHVAVLYKNPSDAFRFASFLEEGLKRGDRCHYLAPAKYHARMLEKIRGLTALPKPRGRSQRLQMSGGFANIASLRRWIENAFLEAECARAPAVRWLEEGSWPDSVGFPITQFFVFHALLNYKVKHYPSAALCQYQLDQMEPQHLFSAIATHRHLLVGGTLIRDNPFYIPAEKFIPLSERDRHRDLTKVFREVGFDVNQLLAALEAYGRIQSGPTK